MTNILNIYIRLITWTLILTFGPMTLCQAMPNSIVYSEQKEGNNTLRTKTERFKLLVARLAQNPKSQLAQSVQAWFGPHAATRLSQFANKVTVNNESLPRYGVRMADKAKLEGIYRALKGYDYTGTIDTEFIEYIRKDLDRSMELARAAVERGVEKVLVAGNGMKALPILLAMIGKKVTLVSPDKICLDSIQFVDQTLSDALTMLGHETSRSNIQLIEGFMNKDIFYNRESPLKERSFDMVTLIDYKLIYPDQNYDDVLFTASYLLNDDAHLAFDFSPFQSGGFGLDQALEINRFANQAAYLVPFFEIDHESGFSGYAYEAMDSELPQPSHKRNVLLHVTSIFAEDIIHNAWQEIDWDILLRAKKLLFNEIGIRYLPELEKPEDIVSLGLVSENTRILSIGGALIPFGFLEHIGVEGSVEVVDINQRQIDYMKKIALAIKDNTTSTIRANVSRAFHALLKNTRMRSLADAEINAAYDVIIDNERRVRLLNNLEHISFNQGDLLDYEPKTKPDLVFISTLPIVATVQSSKKGLKLFQKIHAYLKQGATVVYMTYNANDWEPFTKAFKQFYTDDVIETVIKSPSDKAVHFHVLRHKDASQAGDDSASATHEESPTIHSIGEIAKDELAATKSQILALFERAEGEGHAFYLTSEELDDYLQKNKAFDLSQVYLNGKGQVIGMLLASYDDKADNVEIYRIAMNMNLIFKGSDDKSRLLYAMAKKASVLDASTISLWVSNENSAILSKYQQCGFVDVTPPKLRHDANFSGLLLKATISNILSKISPRMTAQQVADKLWEGIEERLEAGDLDGAIQAVRQINLLWSLKSLNHRGSQATRTNLREYLRLDGLSNEDIDELLENKSVRQVLLAKVVSELNVRLLDGDIATFSEMVTRIKAWNNNLNSNDYLAYGENEVDFVPGEIAPLGKYYLDFRVHINHFLRHLEERIDLLRSNPKRNLMLLQQFVTELDEATPLLNQALELDDLNDFRIDDTLIRVAELQSKIVLRDIYLGLFNSAKANHFMQDPHHKQISAFTNDLAEIRDILNEIYVNLKARYMRKASLVEGLEVVDDEMGRIGYVEGYAADGLTYELSIIAHGDTENNHKGVFHGHTDNEFSHITDQAKAEVLDGAKQWWIDNGEAFRVNPSDFLFVTSPLTRTKETFAIYQAYIKEQSDIEIEVQEDPGVIEIDFGFWDGKTIEQIKSEFGEDEEALAKKYRAGNVFIKSSQGGESFADVLKRVRQWTLRKNTEYKDKKVFAFGHGTFQNAALILHQHDMVQQTDDYIDWRASQKNIEPSRGQAIAINNSSRMTYGRLIGGLKWNTTHLLTSSQVHGGQVFGGGGEQEQFAFPINRLPVVQRNKDTNRFEPRYDIRRRLENEAEAAHSTWSYIESLNVESNPINVLIDLDAYMEQVSEAELPRVIEWLKEQLAWLQDRGIAYVQFTEDKYGLVSAPKAILDDIEAPTYHFWSISRHGQFKQTFNQNMPFLDENFTPPLLPILFMHMRHITKANTSSKLNRVKTQLFKLITGRSNAIKSDEEILLDVYNAQAPTNIYRNLSVSLILPQQYLNHLLWLERLTQSTSRVSA